MERETKGGGTVKGKDVLALNTPKKGSCQNDFKVTYAQR